MSTGFWGINLITDKQRRKAKTIVFNILTFYDFYDEVNYIEEQLKVLYPNNFIIIHQIWYEEWDNLKDVRIFKQD